MSAERVEAILAEHQLGGTVCSCGWRTSVTWTGGPAWIPFPAVHANHRAHVAALVAAETDGLADLERRWSDALDNGCPSCGPVGDCDHIEGYHFALSDVRALLVQPAPSEGSER